jgi:7-cyano-7-deazaguanine synthase
MELSMNGSDGALVLFSGGQDSATCLAWALDRFERVETLGFDYGQRHRVELECGTSFRAALLSRFPAWSGRLCEEHTIRLDALGEISDTALTRKAEIQMQAGGLPNTFVPGRNLVFLTDYSGYPDCRDDTIKALQVALNLGMERRFVLHTPLMWLDKAATWKIAADLGGKVLVDLIREETHSCYLGDRNHRHTWGFGCGVCPACDLRRKGWAEYACDRGADQPSKATHV